MSSPITITMIAPDGSRAEVPLSGVETAKQAGAKVAVQMKSPQGEMAWVPADAVHDAAAKGAKMVPMNVPEAAKASYWDALTNPIGSGGREQGIVGGALQIGGQAIKAAVQPLAHPLQTAGAVIKGVADYATGGPTYAAQQAIKPAVEAYLADKNQGGNALALENLAGQTIGGIEGGRVLGAASAAAVNKAAPVVSKVADKMSVGMYRNALKPPPGSMSAAESTAKVRTGLDYGIPVSAGGLEKLGDLVDDFNNKIAAELNKAPNRPIDPNAVATRADQAKARFAQQVNPEQDVSSIEASKQEYLRKHGATPATSGPNNPQSMAYAPGTPAQPATPYGAAEAQAEKQATYRELRGKYGEQGSAAVEAQKSLARGIKEEIAAHFPEINNLNAGESRLLDLGPTLERAVNRISNNHTIGIGGSIAAGGIKAATNSTGLAAVAGAMKSIVDIPAVKSQLAIALSKGAKIPYSKALARVSAYQAQLGSAAGAAQEYSSGGNSSQ